MSDPETSEYVESTLHMPDLSQDGMEAILERVRLQERAPVDLKWEIFEKKTVMRAKKAKQRSEAEPHGGEL